MSRNKYKGAVISAGHGAVTRGILRDSDVEVLSQGSSFYNQNDFPTLYWLIAFGKWYEKNPVSKITRRDIYNVWKLAQDDLEGLNRIVIAQTPPEVDREYLDQLDGGILHEAFHSLYTTTGSEIDLDRIESIMNAHFDPDIDYGKKIMLVKQLWNIFEDAYIERLGIKQFRGAQPKIEAVHQLVWDKEKESRCHRPLGEKFIDSEGNQRRAFKAIDHLTCYLRDRCESHLSNAPYTEYEEDIKRIVDSKFANIIRDAHHTNDSYDTMELAFRTAKLVHDLYEEIKRQQQQKQQQQQQQQQRQSQGQSSGNSKNQGSGTGQGDTANRKAAGPPDPSQADPKNSNSGSGKGGDEEEEDGAAAGGGDQSDQDQDGDEEAPGAGDSDEEEDGDDAAGGDEDDDLEDVDDDLLEELGDSDSADGMEDAGDALSDVWNSKITPGCPDRVFPYSTEEDRELQVEGEDVNMDRYNSVMDDVRQKTLYIRPRMLSFFRGKTKSRIRHGVKSGRRLSSRRLSDIIKKDDPSKAKPFRKKVRTEARNSVVSLLLDESGSMSSWVNEAREILLTLSATIGTLKIPHEVVGFTTNGQPCIPYDSKDFWERIENEKQFFSRMQGCDWRVYRNFDEPFNSQSYRKMMKTAARGLTPIPDALDFVGQRIVRRKEEQKIIFVVTDGSPQYDYTNWSYRDYLTMVKNHVDDLQAAGVETLFIGVGYDAHYVEEYPNSMHLSRSDNFSQKMAKFIFEQMRRIQRGR